MGYRNQIETLYYSVEHEIFWRFQKSFMNYEILKKF